MRYSLRCGTARLKRWAVTRLMNLRRIVNGIRKVAAGLRPFNESVWPGVHNDLFVAHESIYYFAATLAQEQLVLDAGCGTGYGSSILGRAARSVLGVDIDARSVAYAKRHFSKGNVSFEVADLQQLDFQNRFDLIVASNSIEHLDDPRAFVAGALRALRPHGSLLIAVPPIYGEADAQAHADIHYHRSNLRVTEWSDLLVEAGFESKGFIHHFAREGNRPDFFSHAPSRLQPSDFTFSEVTAAELSMTVSITAVFLARRISAHVRGA